MTSRSFDSRTLRALAALLLVLGLGAPLAAQIAPLREDLGVSGLGLALRKLPVTARVLVVTAHPDDEPSGLLVKLSRGLGVRTALMTLTRGEGGQNEIGTELGEALGVLRTEELAAVHRYDGVEQFFGRSYEFGYSFSVDETLEKWGHDDALSDVVRAIRAFRPDVILTMPLESSGGGQHHQAAAQLAREAFRAAADGARFPEQVKKGFLPWQARKLYQAVEGKPPAGTLVLKTGGFDPLLGMSWNEYGSLARANHKCQGANQLKAEPLSGDTPFALVDSEPPMGGAESDILDGIDVALTRLVAFAPAGDPRFAFLASDVDALRAQVDAAQAALDPRSLDKAAPPLAAGLDLVRRLRGRLQKSSLPEPSRYELLNRLTQKEREFLAALALAQGIVFEAVVDDDLVVPGQSFGVTASVWNQGAAVVKLDEIALSVPEGWKAKRSGDTRTLEPGGSLQVKFSVKVADKVRYAQPYWRRSTPAAYRYDLDVPAYEGLPWASPEVTAALRYTASGGVAGSLEQPAIWRYQGSFVGGEKQKVVASVPLLSVRMTPEITVFPLAAAKSVKREFRATLVNDGKEPLTASVRLEAPPGWVIDPPQSALAFRFEGEEGTARFQVTPPPGVAEGEVSVRAVAASGGQEFRDGYQTIAYDHIQERNLYRPAAVRVKALDVKIPAGVSVGYIMGAGDEVANAIFQLGIPVTFISESGLATGDLSRYTTIVTGIRAYQARKDLRTSHGRLMKYVEDGGNLVVQYNKLDFNQLVEQASPGGSFTGTRGAKLDSPFAPYPGASVTTSRLTDENAPMTMLVPDHALLTTPNRITSRDWDGWVQERGTYFLDTRDVRYSDLLAGTDPFPLNAGDKRGILVEAKLGKGTWTYCGLSLFRQVTNGTDGAYRLLANLVARPRGK